MKRYLPLFFFLIPLQDIAQIPTVGEIYNFNIGDEFHYRSLANVPPNVRREKVIDKVVSANGDSVIYSLARSGYASTVVMNPEPHLEYSFWGDTASQVYTSLNIELTQFDASFQNDTSFSTVKGLCGAQGIGYNYCIGDFETECFSAMFCEGLGNVSNSYTSDVTPNPQGFYMFYYNKNGLECGIADTLTAGIASMKQEDFTLYPNPASDVVHLSRSGNAPLYAEIYDACGKLQKRLLISGNTEVNVADWSPGIYFVKIPNSLSPDQKLVVR